MKPFIWRRTRLRDAANFRNLHCLKICKLWFSISLSQNWTEWPITHSTWPLCRSGGKQIIRHVWVLPPDTENKPRACLYHSNAGRYRRKQIQCLMYHPSLSNVLLKWGLCPTYMKTFCTYVFLHFVGIYIVVVHMTNDVIWTLLTL